MAWSMAWSIAFCGVTTTYAVDSSHVPMLSHPDLVIDVVRAAAKGLHGSSATA